MASNSQCFWVRTLRGKYLQHENFWNVECIPHASWVWKSVLSSRGVLRVRVCYMVGNGSDILIWSDPWILMIPGIIPSSSIDA